MKRNKAFTIVELLIVIVVIAILASVSIVVYNGMQNRAKESKLVSIANTVEKRTLIKQATDGSASPVSTPTSLQDIRNIYGINELKSDVVIMTSSASNNCIASLSDTCDESSLVDRDDVILMHIFISGSTGNSFNGCKSDGGVSISHRWLTKAGEDGEDNYHREIPDDSTTGVGIGCWNVS